LLCVKMNGIEQLTGIYHEKQEGALCAQHALNNLLQREIFSAISLADIARKLDEDENQYLATTSSQRELFQPRQSQNMDDSGFFSIQVLQRALEVFDIELISYTSQQPMAQRAREQPTSIQAYICNLREHWLTIRRFGTQYFDLNSVSATPKLISDTYLSLYLAQLQHSGYSIFICNGVLPPCLADEKLAHKSIDPVEFRQLAESASAANIGGSIVGTNTKIKTRSTFDEDELERAIKASVEHDNLEDTTLQQVLQQSLMDAQQQDEETMNQQLLEKAIAASLSGDQPSLAPLANKDEQKTESTTTTTTTTTTVSSQEPTIEELRQRRLQFFANQTKSVESKKEDESKVTNK